MSDKLTWIPFYTEFADKLLPFRDDRAALIERICADESFGLNADEIEAILRPEDFTGRSAEQVEEFLDGVIRPVLEANRALLGEKQELNV